MPKTYRWLGAGGGKAGSLEDDRSKILKTRYAASGRSLGSGPVAGFFSQTCLEGQLYLWIFFDHILFENVHKKINYDENEMLERLGPLLGPKTSDTIRKIEFFPEKNLKNFGLKIKISVSD